MSSVFFLLFIVFFVRGQVYGPITFGSGSLPTDWTNDSSWTFSTSNASSGYTTPSASGSGNATIINGASNTQYLTSANIDFSSFKSGILKFGVAMKMGDSNEFSYYCSDRKVWEETGYFNGEAKKQGKEKPLRNTRTTSQSF